MRSFTALPLLLATIVATAPVHAQAPVAPQQQIADLMRRDAGLRARIGQLQLDALVARVDRTIGHAAQVREAALRRDIDLYSY